MLGAACTVTLTAPEEGGEPPVRRSAFRHKTPALYTPHLSLVMAANISGTCPKNVHPDTFPLSPHRRRPDFEQWWPRDEGESPQKHKKLFVPGSTSSGSVGW
mmetsp:Transcript_26361/g.61089  ORF Transcript_26361/g.61089 Transcript_26361/m.61089 type:complete len:102 (+) Transcript_26361:129-434(+)